MTKGVKNTIETLFREIKKKEGIKTFKLVSLVSSKNPDALRDGLELMTKPLTLTATAILLEF